ncbi:MAG: competence/damage-inducible protein A, partial [Candidatus Omnitrophica bacterium]|nr:competence/damage-inducible protein A [Candidatus Omnitrophota bacterium]
GTELLLGHVVNTNAAFIAGKLAQMGIDHYYETTVGDNPRRLADAIKNAACRSDIVITTGGLGPTVDDITTQTIADVFSKKLVLEKGALKDIKDFFKQISRDIPRDTLRQAMIPEGAKWLKNPHGTAPGFILTIPPHPTLSPKGRGIKGEGEIIIALPGPPREMQPMVEDYIIPYLKKRICERGAESCAIIKSRSIKLFGLAEAKVNQQVKDLLSFDGQVTVGIYAKQGEVELKIMAKARDEKSADKEIGKVEKTIRKRLNAYIYGADKETMEENIVNLLIKKDKKIAIAESCTGGCLANLITNVPGASRAFIEGVITYSNDSKTRELGVKPETIKKYGAVSPQVAREMADGIRKNSGAAMGISITGIAGPAGATKTKPVGLVYIALSVGKRNTCHRFNFPGSRTEVKHQAVLAALDMLRISLSPLGRG